jgi:hypothetical protein
VFVLLLVFGATCCTTYNAVRFQVPGCYRRRVQSEASVGFGFGTSVGSVSPDSLVCVYQIGSHDTRTTGLTCIDREIEIHRPTSLIHIGAVRTSTAGPKKSIQPLDSADLTDQDIFDRLQQKHPTSSSLNSPQLVISNPPADSHQLWPLPPTRNAQCE